MIERRKTRAVTVGGVAIGGDAPVSVQSMTTTPTRDAAATVAQVRRLVDAGADLVRVAVVNRQDTAALPEVLAGSGVPIIADVHFHYARALEAVAAGVHKIRLNPGNIQDRQQVAEVIAACRERSVPIRVGVNEGSVVERRDAGRREADRRRVKDDPAGLVGLMVEKLSEYLQVFEQQRFDRVVLSAKSSDAATAIGAYRAISRRFDFPLHLGLTHAGPPETGRIRSAAALGALLAEGIGDTIRISYAADPVLEVVDARELLACLGLRKRIGPDLIACPTCGRTQADIIAMTADVRQRLAGLTAPLKVAVMGCVVNGPGEAEGADVALCAAGPDQARIYVRGVPVRDVRRDEMLDALWEACIEAARGMTNDQ